jgi:hypothetical protein
VDSLPPGQDCRSGMKIDQEKYFKKDIGKETGKRYAK